MQKNVVYFNIYNSIKLYVKSEELTVLNQMVNLLQPHLLGCKYQYDTHLTWFNYVFLGHGLWPIKVRNFRFNQIVCCI